MTDRPYTDDDLRAEAARQHAALTEDPDFMGVGEQMQDQEIESLLPPRRPTAPRARTGTSCSTRTSSTRHSGRSTT